MLLAEQLIFFFFWSLFNKGGGLFALLFIKYRGERRERPFL
jgi:hypothetical protein